MKVRVGDRVEYRPGFGAFPPTIVTVRGLEITDYPRDKDGQPVQEVDWALVQQNRVLFTFDGNWAYSEQIIRKI